MRIGTSSWSSPDWRGPLYPEGAEAGSFLAHYATHFDTVECDATFYRIPSAKTSIPVPDSQRPATGTGEPRCTVAAGSGGCTDPGVVLDARPVLFFQGYAACGPSGGEEGP